MFDKCCHLFPILSLIRQMHRNGRRPCAYARHIVHHSDLAVLQALDETTEHPVDELTSTISYVFECSPARSLVSPVGSLVYRISAIRLSTRSTRMPAPSPARTRARVPMSQTVVSAGTAQPHPAMSSDCRRPLLAITRISGDHRHCRLRRACVCSWHQNHGGGDEGARQRRDAVRTPSPLHSILARGAKEDARELSK